jgi:amino acid adenylation domain-containing protein
VNTVASSPPQSASNASSRTAQAAPESIAIIGMAGRFPQAATLTEFWSNLREGREAISFFPRAEAEWLAIEQPCAPDDPCFVPARAVLERAEWFDPGFFRMNPREAAMMDPQHRVFLECAWEALENAGCDPQTIDGSIGVFGGAGFNTYLFNNLLSHRMLLPDYGALAAVMLNDKDYLCSTVGYKFDLRGPCINVQSACSTSLVAVSLACQNLLAYGCDVALAGGVSITFPTNHGHRHVEGAIMSADGHCRVFDAQASGTVMGSGAGVVVLKRLSEATAAGDRIWAVIKGYATNNDGAAKIGFTAPSIDGQAECIAQAQAFAQVEANTISYIEAHGTGTPLGDPIEVAGLTKAFGSAPGIPPYCGIGSVKSNIGHLDVAAGVAGLIKTTLALAHGELPPTLHFSSPNPEIDFACGPFFVNDRLRPWPRGPNPRRAGVSSFGIGGTNAHVVLEEAPPRVPSRTSRAPQLLVLSARTPSALEAATDRLATYLHAHPDVNLADVAFTLQTGRKRFEHRRAVVVSDIADAATVLRSRVVGRIVDGGPTEVDSVAFLFPGQGAQTANMARGLYDDDPEFRQLVDRACERLRPALGLDLRTVLFPAASQPGTNGDRPAALLTQTRITQPAMFIIEYALVQLWARWGVTPVAMIGHSLGEYVAACVAGVFAFDDGLTLVAERARLMQAQPPGAMVAVRLPSERLSALLDPDLALAAINAPGTIVVSGPIEAVAAFEVRLGERAIAFRRLATSHAFHSSMLDPVMAPLRAFLCRMPLRPPRLRWVSNLTGTWITPEQATDPDYWTAQLRRPVRFADGIEELMRAGHRLLVEVGPGNTLATLARQQPSVAQAAPFITSTFGSEPEPARALPAMLHTLGALWTAGVKVDWHAGWQRSGHRHVVELPTYPFERTRCWIEPAAAPPGNRLEEHGADRTAPPTVSVNRPAPPPLTGDTPSTLTAVTDIFQQLSGLDLSAAADRTFNELGFDSLFLTQTSAAIARRFNVTIAFHLLRDEFFTLRKLGMHLAAHCRAEGISCGARAAPVFPKTAGQRIPLTAAQREIWVVSQLGEGASCAYIESAMLQLRGTVDIAALCRSLHDLAARHEALRTTFTKEGDRQIIADAGEIEFWFEDFSGDITLREGAGGDAMSRVDYELRRPFDLERGPLCRLVLVRIKAETYVLALIVHHIVCDGWSLGVLVRELTALYLRHVGCGGAALAAPPSFADYVQKSRGAPGAAELAAAEHWARYFADGVPVFELPTDRPRPVARNYAGRLVTRLLSPELTTAVKQFCVEQQSTVFTAMLAAFTVLLHRLTGQNEIIVGVPAAVQALDGQPDLVGHFANLLPIRSRITAEQRFDEHLAAIQRDVDRALVHWRYPFVQLLRQLKIRRDSSRVPLTPVVFNTHHLRTKLQWGDTAVTSTLPPKHFVNFDLNFNVAVVGDGIVVGCYYSEELFEEATILRWIGHFETLLRRLVADCGQRLATLPILTSAERERMVRHWNNSALPFDRTALITDLFEAQVGRTPHAIALVAGDERITYRDLDARADELAWHLRARGVGPDVLVGICLERTAKLLVAILAVLKAGAAYVPLDPRYPRERLQFIVNDARMSIVMTEKDVVSRLPTGEFRSLMVDDLSAVPAGQPASKPALDRPTATSLAYVIYTSGSTGGPKGVAMPHRSVVALVAWAGQWYTAEELDGVLFSTSTSFDISIFEIFCPLCLGGRIVLADDLLHLTTLATRDEVRFLSGVPSAVAELVRAKALPPSVTTVALAGEVFPQLLVDALYALPHIRRVFELYGPTETTVYSTGSLRKPGTAPTLGRPFPNEQIYILDKYLEPVPVGVHGEIYIGGDKLARGYLNRPELTAEKFIPSPFVPGERLYRSGDFARWRADGTIESLGREDDQVKVRGFRIELAEVEAMLGRHPAVVECSVVARPDPGGGTRLLAYAVLRAGLALEARSLRAYLQQVLPGYMVPAACSVLDKLPRTVSGKIDRGALPEPQHPTANEGGSPSRSLTEEVITDIWCEVLGVGEMGVHDNFFELGGHSLHAMQVLSRIANLLEIELTWREFFSAPTIAALAANADLALNADIRANNPELASVCEPAATPAP